MRTLLAPLSILYCTVFFAGCGGQPASDAPASTKKVIGAALLTQTHVFYQDMVAAMSEAAKKQDFDLRIQYAEFDSSKQNNQIETLMLQKVDALVVAPNDSSGIAPVIADARARGIPVFTVDIAAHGADVVSHIASDNFQGGVLVAAYLAGLLDGKGKVAVIDHPAVASVQDRVAGFEQELKKYPEITIVQKAGAEGQRDKAFRVAQDVLQANPDLGGIFGINDDSALGALGAVEAAGLDKKIVIVGFDGTPEACDTIAKGKALKADCVQFPKEIGKTAIDIITAYFNGEQVPKVKPVQVKILDQAVINSEQKQ